MLPVKARGNNTPVRISSDEKTRCNGVRMEVAGLMVMISEANCTVHVAVTLTVISAVIKPVIAIELSALNFFRLLRPVDMVITGVEAVIGVTRMVFVADRPS